MALEKIIFPRGEGKKKESSSIVSDNNILKGTLKSEKNGDIAAIVSKTEEEPMGIDNKCIVYKL